MLTATLTWVPSLVPPLLIAPPSRAALQALETAVEGNVGGSTTVEVVSDATNATHYITFVDSDNTSGTQEAVYTDAGLYYNPFTNQFSANGVNTGVLSLNSVDVTATAAELNILDGVTATATETQHAGWRHCYHC